MLQWNSGLKTNDIADVEKNVFFIKLDNPNAKPKNAPFLEPNTIEPIITGTWIIVTLITGFIGI